MTASTGMRISFISQALCLIRIAQHPGANRTVGTGVSFGIVVEDICHMATLLGVETPSGSVGRALAEIFAEE